MPSPRILDRFPVESVTDAFVAALTPPPVAGSGVCDVCHGPVSAGYVRCWSCYQTTRQVSHSLELIAPISLSVLGEQLHTVLAGYKRSSDVEARTAHTVRVAGLLHRFLHDHGQCVASAAGGGWDTVTTVPSKDPAVAPVMHPLAFAVGLAEPVASQFEPLLTPHEPDRIHRASSSDDGFRATAAARGRRVLLVDDTFTSGATFQSAASALALGGATVVAGVVIARYMRPDFSPEAEALWERQRASRFDFDTCCLERP